MEINKKGKRHLKFNGVQFLWCVRPDDVSGDSWLNIVSDKKDIYLKYRINQIDDNFINPTVFIEKSDKLKIGTYRFFPPFSDEIVSSYVVSQILKWYYNQDSSIKPI
ncbi:hypothetical protein [Metaclostridioides mangenotii]|nr:hypothetical protein [Clostridioides mangenotii]